MFQRSGIVLFGSFLCCAQVFGQGTLWNWESGSLEGWYGDPLRGNPAVSLASGWQSSLAMSVTGATNSVVRVANPGIESDLLLGANYGDFLSFLPGASISLDMNTPVPTDHGVYLDLVIYGNDTQSRWVCYPYDDFGSVTEVGGGWYHCSFANNFALQNTPDVAPLPELQNSILLVWNGFAPNDGRVDNFLIQVPEPSTASLALVAVAGYRVLHRRRCLK